MEYRPHENQDLGPLHYAVSLLLQAAKVGAQAQLVRDCRTLLKRLTAEVEISKAITCFPTVRLPIDVRRAAIFRTFLKTSVLRAMFQTWERENLILGALPIGPCRLCAVVSTYFSRTPRRNSKASIHPPKQDNFQVIVCFLPPT